MNRFVKSGLITAIGLAGVYFLHNKIDNLPAKIILEAPLVLTSVSLAYKALMKKQDEEISVQQHQYLSYLLGNSGTNFHQNAGKVYRASKEFQMLKEETLRKT